MSPEIVAQLAPTGVLRAGINMSNFLLVTGRSASGDPEGVSPSMAKAVADRLGVPVRYVPFPKPGLLADAADDNVWDIGLIGAEPQRAEKIAFTAAYTEIEATYLVPAGSKITAIDQVDRPGIRIAVSARSAYDLWLERNIKHATVLRVEGGPAFGDFFGRQPVQIAEIEFPVRVIAPALAVDESAGNEQQRGPFPDGKPTATQNRLACRRLEASDVRVHKACEKAVVVVHFASRG